MNKKFKQAAALMLGTTMIAASIAGCGGGDGGQKPSGGDGAGSAEAVDTVGKSTDFTFLITTAITQNQYDDYDKNPVAQWWMSQEWDADGDGTGTPLNIDFWAPTSGAESDYVNTLVSTEEYPDVMAMLYSSESANELYEEGMALDLTAYVDKYMPNYKAYMEAHPEFLYTNKVDGEDKIIQLYILNEDYLTNPWAGFCYRRDWIVQFGSNPETGEAFSGEWKDGEWTDNVVFPSGNTDPVYISDWEWMFEIFATAQSALGMTDGYVVQLPYQGAQTTGDLVSGFNTGVVLNYDADGKAVFSGVSDGMRAYVECISNWYSKGWVDEAFAERAGDLFFMIDAASVYSGQVGLWYGMTSQLLNNLAGDGQNPWTADAVVYAAATPINDVYGDASVQNVEPTVFYQDPLLSSSFVITDKAADKDIATLLTALDYFYSEEGSAVFSFGFSDEMLAGMEGTDWYNFYVENGLENGTWTKDGDNYVLNQAIIVDPDLADVTSCKRVLGMSKVNNVDRGHTETMLHSLAELTKYKATGNILADVTSQLSASDQTAQNVLWTDAGTCMAQWLPMFANGTYDVTNDDDWAQYVQAMEALNYQAVVDAINEVKGN